MGSSSLHKVGSVAFKGNVKKGKDISAVERVGKYLVLGSDEGNRVQVLREEGNHYRVERRVPLNDTEAEIDIEGIASEGNLVYVVGSHSWKRQKLDEDSDYLDNRQAIEQLHPPDSNSDDRDSLYRFTLDEDGQIANLVRKSLRGALNSHPVLVPFLEVPGKENGVDIEGIAVADGTLYVGFRGPVLRDNYVPILTCVFDNPGQGSQLLYVPLAGLGIRDLARVKQGFLILAGAVGDGPGKYRLYCWDGHDCLPGKRSGGRQGKVKYLGKVPAKKKAQAEGLAILKEKDSEYEILIVYDGVKDGGAMRFRLAP